MLIFSVLPTPLAAHHHSVYNSGIVSNSTTDTYTYGNSDWGDLLTAYNGEGITYDANGNPLSYYNGKRYTFSWQYGRRLASIVVDGNTYTYTYNAEGLRVTKTVDGVEHIYFYDGTELLVEEWGNCYLRFTYDEQGRPFSVDYYNGTTLETYYYVLNLQGDVIEIRNSINNVVCKYTYDAWGKMLSMKDGSGNAITSAGHIGNLNPLRYRGYYYDNETGLYYLRSRYYDPVICRFVNADGYISTGQGMLGYNMFAYCGNNPVICADSNGQFWGIVIGVTLVVGLATLLSGCSAEPKPEPYKSADDAAKAFSEQVYSSSSYIRHEYSTEIYSRTINGETTYNYNPPRAGKPHSASVGRSTPKGTKIVAYAHTHPNSNVFSGADIRAAENLKINAYVVGPNLELQRYSLLSASIINLGVISPIALTDADRSYLVKKFRVSWENHLADECGFNCENMIWPTP